MNTQMNDRLRFRERIGYGMGDYAGNLLTSFMTAFLLIYFTNVAGAGPAEAAFVIAISKLFDGISDLCMGVVVDRTRSKFGKARPWLIRLCLPLAAAVVLLFSVPGSLSGTFRLIYMFLTYNLVSTILYTGISVPYAAMNGLLTADQYERGILGNIRMLMGVAATMTVNTVVLKLVLFFGDGSQYDRRGWTLACAVLAAVMAVCYLITFCLCRERVTEETGTGAEKVPVKQAVKALFTNRYWLLIVAVMFLMYLQMACFFGSTAYYAQYVMGKVEYYTPLSNAIAMAQILTMLLPAPFLMKRIGKRNTLLIGIVIAGAGFAGAGLAPAQLTVQTVLSVIKGIGSGLGAATMFGMLQDSITYGQWKNGFGSAGRGNAASSFCTKLGSGAGAAVLGWLLSAGGFRAELAVQPAGAQTVVNALFSYIPAIIMLFAFACVCFYDLDRKYDGILSQIQEKSEETN